MAYFIDEAYFRRHFPFREDACILTVGYDNFNMVKPLHTFRVQSFYTWHFILSGSGFLEIDGNKFPVCREQMFFIPPGVKMRYFPSEDDPWEYVWFSLTGNAAKQYGEQLGFSVRQPVKTSRYFPTIRSKLEKLFASLIKGNGGIFATLSAFYGILDDCISGSGQTGIEWVKRHIDESFALPDFSVRQLCYDAGLSHAHLLRLFKEAYGITVIKYVINKRIALACELLKTTDLSVKSVAFSCGFSEEAHFMKTFKKEMGVSALYYRKYC